jgi:DNA polymerase
MPLVTLDFETYYCSKTFSLSKMTTEEYVRDPRFQVIGCAIKFDNAPAQWYPMGPDLLQAFAAIDWSQVVAVAHNALFDAAVLRWIFGHKPARWYCTLKLARGLFGMESSMSLAAIAERLQLGAKGKEVVAADGKRLEHFTPVDLAAYGRYCENDTELCFQILKQLLPAYPHTEREMVAWTVEQFADPVLELDVPMLQQELAELRVKLQAARDACGMTQAALRSDGAFAEALIALGVAPPTKISPKTGEEAWAFSKQDVEFMDLLEHEDPRVVALVEARLGNKTSIAESRLQRFIDIGTRGKLPVPLAYAGAMTTKRWGGTDKINLQNLPRNGNIRKAIRAPKGYYLVVGDLSQIELRVNAWQSGQQEILDELTKPGGDTYSSMATDVYGYTVQTKKTHPVERFVGKTAVLGCGYGCGPPKFQTMLKVAARRDRIVLSDESLDFAKKVVFKYRDKNSKIKDFWDVGAQAIVKMASGEMGSFGPYPIMGGRIFLPNGQFLYYPNLRRATVADALAQSGEWIYDKRMGRATITTRIYGPKLVENITQAAARLPMCDAIEQLWADWGKWCRPLFTVHDEIVTMWPDAVPREDAKRIVMHCLTNPKNPKLREFFAGLPLAADVDAGETYGDCK